MKPKMLLFIPRKRISFYSIYAMELKILCRNKPIKAIPVWRDQGLLQKTEHKRPKPQGQKREAVW